jgi:rubrerythrin
VKRHGEAGGIHLAESSLTELIRIIELMVDAETAAGDFYKNCAERFEYESDLWMSLANDEFLHAEILTKLWEMIQRKPHEFQPGKLPALTEVQSFISLIRSYSEKLEAGTWAIVDALLAASDIETAVIEASYTEILETKNPAYLEALANLSKATVGHRNKIQRKIRAYNKRGIPLDPGA